MKTLRPVRFMRVQIDIACGFQLLDMISKRIVIEGVLSVVDRDGETDGKVSCSRSIVVFVHHGSGSFID